MVEKKHDCAGNIKYLKHMIICLHSFKDNSPKVNYLILKQGSKQTRDINRL